MDALRIEAKYDTPKVVLDATAGVFEICGRSIPEDAGEFYKPVIEWVENNANNALASAAFIFKLDYINTASSRMIQQLLLSLKEVEGITIRWLYKEDDEDMQDVGQDFAQIVEFPIELKAY